MDLCELDLRLLAFFDQRDSHGELLLWQVLLAIFEVFRRKLHGPVYLRVGNRDRVLGSELVVVVVAVGLEVGWVVAEREHTIDLDGGVLFPIDFAIFVGELAEWDLVGDEGDGVAVPVIVIVSWRENPDFSSEARFARYKACPCPGTLAIIPNPIDVDRLRLWVAHGCDPVVLTLAITEDLLLHDQPDSLLGLLDLLLASLGDLFSQVLIEIRFALPMRISIFLKKNEAQEAGFLC